MDILCQHPCQKCSLVMKKGINFEKYKSIWNR